MGVVEEGAGGATTYGTQSDRHHDWREKHKPGSATHAEDGNVRSPVHEDGRQPPAFPSGCGRVFSLKRSRLTASLPSDRRVKQSLSVSMRTTR